MKFHVSLNAGDAVFSIHLALCGEANSAAVSKQLVPNNQIKAGALRCVSEKDPYSSPLCLR